MIDFETRADGVVLPVRAMAGASSNAIRGIQNGCLKISVTQVAEKGKANKALADVIAKQLRLRKSQLALLAGATSNVKTFLIKGIGEAELRARIEGALISG